MPRTSNAKNTSYYHYIVHTLDEQGNKIESKYRNAKVYLRNNIGYGNAINHGSKVIIKNLTIKNL